MSASPSTIGAISSVSGSRITAVLDESADPDGGIARIGALVRTETRLSTVYGTIHAAETQVFGAVERRSIVIDLLGEVMTGADGTPGLFQRGVSLYPVLGHRVATTTTEDYRRVYAAPSGFAVRIGTLYQDPDLPAFVTTDDLLGKHFAVLGTTGSGKSCTVALMLRSILSAHPHGHVVMLDPHAEYSAAFADMAEIVDIGNLVLPFWLLDFEEAVTVLVRGGTMHEQESQITILKECILAAKRKYAGDGPEALSITVDTPVPYRLGDLIRIIDNAMGKLDKPDSTAPYLRLKTRLDSLNGDKRYAFMFSGVMTRDNMTQIVSRTLRIPTHGKPLTIVDLSGVPSEVVNVVVAMLCRMVFDLALWSDRSRTPPVLLVCEEAHRYVPADERSGFDSTRRALARIAKEGRKYGVSLCLVTQRPSELSASVLSQCGTLFALRMGNESDQRFVANALPENARGMLDVLPALRRQEAIVVGEGVTVPMRIRFDDLAPEHRPRSASAVFSQAWQRDSQGMAFIEDAVQRWRQQVRWVPPALIPGYAAADPPDTPAAAATSPTAPQSAAQPSKRQIII